MNKGTFAFLVAAAGGLVFATNASARSVEPPMYESTLTRFNLDPQLGFPREIASGVVRHLPYSGRLGLVVTEKVPCSEDGICLPVMPRVLNVKLAITDERTTSCGSHVIVAEQDLRPVDGRLQTLTVIDHTGNTCPTFIALPAVEVIYGTSFVSRGDGIERVTRSTFTGDAFVVKSSRRRDR